MIYKNSVKQVILLCLFILGSYYHADAKTSDIIIEPDGIKIGLFYNGKSIKIKTDIPAEYDIAVVLTGEKENLKLKKKGKVGGFLWMNVGELSYDRIPSVYFLGTSKPLGSLSSKKNLADLGIGYDSLKKGIDCNSDAGKDACNLFGELIKLKEKDNLFAINENSVKIHTAANGAQEAFADFFLSPKFPIKDYNIKVYGFRNGSGHLLATSKLKLEYAPLTSFIATMAQTNGLIYGIIAVIIAIIAGIFTGFVFGRKGGGGH